VLVLLFLIIGRKRLEEEDRIKNFVKTYSTIFEDFKSEGMICWVFYVFYVLRRLAIVLCIHFATDPVLQICISFTITMTVILI
jgi:hypothetical protein